jgi:hypothetical protein
MAGGRSRKRKLVIMHGLRTGNHYTPRFEHVVTLLNVFKYISAVHIGLLIHTPAIPTNMHSEITISQGVCNYLQIYKSAHVY